MILWSRQYFIQLQTELWVRLWPDIRRSHVINTLLPVFKPLTLCESLCECLFIPCESCVNDIGLVTNAKFTWFVSVSVKS
jgi:hypothetical protein